ncbi:MAG: hypothetical protein IRZ33_09020 [Alicyclobacillaceae bacterium]|nr:hypothetical protein [Alicyclobacillaceae bacterium]
MQQLFAPLLGTRVRIEQHNDVGLTGQLVNVQSDYVSVYTEDARIVHYPVSHIKSVTTNIVELPQPVSVPDLAFPASFADLLSALWMQPIRIELGEGSRQGVLVQITDETICLVVSSKELVYYPVHQIVNLSPIYELTEVRGESAGPDGDGTEGAKQSGSGETRGDGSGENATSNITAAEDSAQSLHDRGGMQAERAEARAGRTAPVDSQAARLTLFSGESKRQTGHRPAHSGSKTLRTTARGTPNGSQRHTPRVIMVRQPNTARPSWVHPQLRVSPASAVSDIG